MSAFDYKFKNETDLILWFFIELMLNNEWKKLPIKQIKILSSKYMTVFLMFISRKFINRKGNVIDDIRCLLIVIDILECVFSIIK